MNSFYRLFIFFYLFAATGRAQITSPVSSVVVPTAYTNGFPNDSIYVFCANPGTLKGKSPAGMAPFTFSWTIYDAASGTYLPYVTASGDSSVIGGLPDGGYLLTVTDFTGAQTFCGRAWVFNNLTSTDAGTVSPACSTNITLNGTTDAMGGFVYYNPPYGPFTIGASTSIEVCFDVVHPFVSDLGFHLVGPAACGSPVITLAPAVPACNSGDHVNNLCFVTTGSASFDMCTASTPLAGSYAAYGPAPGTPIDWSPLYGCNTTAGNWSVQVFDCGNGQTGTLTGASVVFSDNTNCGFSTYAYASGTISAPIADLSCTFNSATTYRLPMDSSTFYALTLNNTITSFAWSSNNGTIVPGATSSLHPILPAPDEDTWFYLQATDNLGCSKTDSVFFENNCPAECVLEINTVVSVCDPATNTYAVTGTIVFDDAPTTGTLVVTNSCGTSVVLYPPFVSPMPFVFPGLVSSGFSCETFAYFTDSLFCGDTVTYTAPAPCATDCSIYHLEAEVSCDPVTNKYGLSGQVYFVNPPPTGTLTIQLSCGGVVNLPLPLTSPASFSFTGLFPSTYAVYPPAVCTVNAHFTNDAGCNMSIGFEVPKVPKVANSMEKFCKGDTARLLFAHPAGGTWTLNPGLDPTGWLDPNLAPLGLYTSTYTQPGACPLRAITTYRVSNPPELNLVMDEDTVCLNDELVFNITGATNYDFPESWGMANIMGTEYYLLPQNTGTFSGWIIGKDNNTGCSDSIMMSYTVLPIPNIVIAQPPPVCPGDSVLLVAYGAQDYSWSPSTEAIALSSDSVLLIPSQTAYYMVFGSSGMCWNSTGVIVNVATSQVIVVPEPSVGYAPLTVFFDNQSSAMSYVWDFGNGQTATTSSYPSDMSMVYTEPGIYTVTVISYLGPCTDTMKYTIEVLEHEASIEVPNIITANGDGLNDVFRINDAFLVTLDVRIFNRWGKQVGQIFRPDGFWEGEEHAEGTYFYTLTARGLDQQVFEQKGYFSLVK